MTRTARWPPRGPALARRERKRTRFRFNPPAPSQLGLPLQGPRPRWMRCNDPRGHRGPKPLAPPGSPLLGQHGQRVGHAARRQRPHRRRRDGWPRGSAEAPSPDLTPPARFRYRGRTAPQKPTARTPPSPCCAEAPAPPVRSGVGVAPPSGSPSLELPPRPFRSRKDRRHGRPRGPAPAGPPHVPHRPAPRPEPQPNGPRPRRRWPSSAPLAPPPNGCSCRCWPMPANGK
jgi:hypothetical protein